MLYTEAVRHLLLVIVLGILVADATGLEALVSPEPCSSIEDTRPDGACPALCVRCACCAQPVVPQISVLLSSMPVPEMFFDLYLPSIPRSAPAKIFHVPKLASR